MQRIPYELLVDLAEGRVAEPEATELRARVAADPLAANRLAALERLISAMREDTSVDAPPHVISRALRLMGRPAATPAPGPMRRLVATLMRDSWHALPLHTGLRSVQAWPRALLLNAGDRELDLQVAPRDHGWQLVGQVLGPEEPGAVTLSSPAERVSARLNELGEFVLPPVAPGRYTLTVTQGELEIVVPGLEIGTSSSQS
jgi:hypothetical protein